MALKAGHDLECPDGACPPSEADALSRANTLANVSNVAFVIGWIGALTGLVTMLLALDEESKQGFAASYEGLTLRF